MGARDRCGGLAPRRVRACGSDRQRRSSSRPQSGPARGRETGLLPSRRGEEARAHGAPSAARRLRHSSGSVRTRPGWLIRNRWQCRLGGSSRTMPTFPSVTYFTIADSNYFLGAAALINSLELTGNHGSVVVVDAGLEAWQRERLRAAATVIPLDAPAGLAPTYYKSYMGASITGEVLVYFDSDIIVTDSLGGIISLAASGRICAAPDTHSERFFPEWSDVLPLAGALRRQVYVNAGFLALAPARWPGFYRRWKELCDAMLDRAPPMHTLSLETALRNPRAYHDQDALNAMLMTELPPEALAPINGERVVPSRQMARVRFVYPK